MATGTLLGALRGYFGAMAAVEKLAHYRIVASMSDTEWPAGLNEAMLAIVDAGRRDAASISSQLTGGSADDAALLEGLSDLIPRVQSEVESFVSGGVSTGSARKVLGQLSPAIRVAQWAVKWAAAEAALAEEAAVGGARAAAMPLGTWIKQALKWVFGIGAGVAGTTILYRVWQATDPMTSIARAFEAQAIIDNHEDQALFRCAGDKACEAEVRAKHSRMSSAFSKELLPGGDECGLLDAPAGAMIGGLIGIGFGWAGMRRLMRGFMRG